MSSRASFAILLGAVAAIGLLFFRVIQPFLFPLFFSVVLTVLIYPVHAWLTPRLGGYRRISALLVTLTLILVGLLPTTAIILLAGSQLIKLTQTLAELQDVSETGSGEPGSLDGQLEQWRMALDAIKQRVPQELWDRSAQSLESVLPSVVKFVSQRTLSMATDAIGITVGIVIMMLAVYYLLADGERLLAEVRRFSPLDDDDEVQLMDQFGRVCRGVVLGSVSAGVVQGLLGALGFWLAGTGSVWLLAVLIMLFSFIPFLGAAAIWIPAALLLLADRQWGWGAFLVVYGTIVISGSDNVIKAYMLHGRAQMHPLIALVTVLGAIKWIGLWGIFVGPMSAAFFYAFLNILHRRLKQTSPALSPESPDAATDSGESTESAPQF